MLAAFDAQIDLAIDLPGFAGRISLFPPVPPPMPDTSRISRLVLYGVNIVLTIVAIAALVSLWVR